ncbi:enoyl-CoA hydratase-related protein [Deinococcus sp. Marseille-Q6407]|uniref:enoyl-CoA hydratase-related protein n=1 Tax=Deinococcus sp. Marseille-Q6407 TaxID=2969223 RepID=UPI0021C19A43|nr:enoyl-CoA hydratase-related protein [Deinococcus sp. Marseille-Q6407]
MPTVELSHSGHTATLTLTAKKGSMPPAFWQELPQALRKLGEARVLIVRGQDIFSAGLDVNATLPAIQQSGDFWGAVQPMQDALDAVAAVEIPVIAAVHGHCIGAGLELIAACDLRLCSANAQFSLPEVRLGLVADLGGLQRLPGIIGRGRTTHLALTGAPIDARTAESWGLVTGVLDTPEALFAQAEALAAQLAELPPHALKGTKQVLREALPHAEGLRQSGEFNAAALK